MAASSCNSRPKMAEEIPRVRPRSWLCFPIRWTHVNTVSIWILISMCFISSMVSIVGLSGGNEACGAYCCSHRLYYPICSYMFIYFPSWHPIAGSLPSVGSHKSPKPKTVPEKTPYDWMIYWFDFRTYLQESIWMLDVPIKSHWVFHNLALLVLSRKLGSAVIVRWSLRVIVDY